MNEMHILDPKQAMLHMYSFLPLKMHLLVNYIQDCYFARLYIHIPEVKINMTGSENAESLLL